MNDFYKTIYNRALETRTLDFGFDRDCLNASKALDELMEQLHPDAATHDTLMCAINDLLYYSNVLSLSYGFRLAVQVIRPTDPVYPARV